MDNNDASLRLEKVKKLENALKWEIRPLYLAGISVVTYPLPPLQVVGFVCIALFAVSSMVSFFVFSFRITAAFLSPLVQTLDEGGASVRSTAGYKRLQQTKRMTFWGTCLIVGSATVFYILSVLWALKVGRSNPWVNALVIGFTGASILNDIGMVLVCGVFKNLPSVSSSFTSLKQSNKEGLPAEPSFSPNSQASSVYLPDEAS